MTTNDDWVRERAHSLSPKCKGGWIIGDDHVRYHSNACDEAAAALHEAIERGRAEQDAAGWTAYRGAAEAAHKLSISFAEERANAEQALRLAHEMQASALAAERERLLEVQHMHLGNVLSLLADLDEGDRSKAFDEALGFYNGNNPTAMVEPTGIATTYLVHKHPVLGICELTKQSLGIADLEAKLARLANPDEALVEAVVQRVVAGEAGEHDREFLHEWRQILLAALPALARTLTEGQEKNDGTC